MAVATGAVRTVSVPSITRSSFSNRSTTMRKPSDFPATPLAVSHATLSLRDLNERTVVAASVATTTLGVMLESALVESTAAVGLAVATESSPRRAILRISVTNQLRPPTTLEESDFARLSARAESDVGLVRACAETAGASVASRTEQRNAR